MQLPGTGTVALLLCWWTTLGRGSSPGDPWAQCKSKSCESKFADGTCNRECAEPDCLRDGFDCIKEEDKGHCKAGHVHYCRNHYDDSFCDHGCNNAPCGWDGSDCHADPVWAKGTLIVHARIPYVRGGTFQNNSLLWSLSVLLRTTVKLRDRAPLHPSSDLLKMQTQQLTDLLKPTAPATSEGSLLFLQVDNRPCLQQPEPTCFPFAQAAGRFLQARMAVGRSPSSWLPEVGAVIQVLGVMEELGDRSERIKPDTSPVWLWPVIGVAVGLGLVTVVAVVLVVVWMRRRRRRRRREGGGGGGEEEERERMRHRSNGTDNNNGSKAWVDADGVGEERGGGGGRGGGGKGRRGHEKNGLLKNKKKKGKETGKKRREPLGEDAIRLGPLRKDLDIGSDTDMTQSSMEDVRYSRRDTSIHDHRTPEQKNFRLLQAPSHAQSPLQTPPRGWDRNATPSHQRAQTPTNVAPVQWCGPDGSVVLIRAVRSGLDRVVLELLRAGVPVNNTDHTGRSALHWACTVNHLALARTLIRYGAAVDLQDNKSETALFLSALHGCYDTARLLLLNGANQELCDHRGWRPLDVAREAMHPQVLELLLAHRGPRGGPGPAHVSPDCEVLWDDRGFLYSPWAAAAVPSLPGRSASFSGSISPRGLSTPPPSNWGMIPVQCPSPQNWRPTLQQSATALVTPRILGRPPRPISTLQEVTSEAEEEEREAARDRQVPRAVTPHSHFLSPQPAPRQRSFSCTQHAFQRRSSGNPGEMMLSVAPPLDKAAIEQVEKAISPPPREAPIQLDGKASIHIPPKPPVDLPKDVTIKNSNHNQKNEKANYENAASSQPSVV